MPSPSKKRKVLLVGWDAADWKVIHPLVDAGKMPHLARMMEQGVIGNLSTLNPVLSPTLWTSIATGKRPYKHGVHGFSEPDPVSGGIRPVTNLSRKTKAVWNILNQNDLNTITVGWWPSNPAEPLSKGVMVSNDYQTAHGSTASPEELEKWPLKPGTIHPERLIKHLKPLRFHPAELTEEDIRPFMPGLEGLDQEELNKAAKEPRVQSLMKIIADCTSIHSAATALMQNEPWDLMAVYYDAIDHFGHAFMKFHPPQRQGIEDWDYRLFNHCVEAGYVYHDMMLGTLLHLGGEDTTVILISDHGFHPDDLRPTNIPREPAGPAIEHRQLGIFAAMGPGFKKDERIYGAGLLDICPTLLHLFGLPVGEDMDGKVLLDIYVPNDDGPPEIEQIPSWDAVEGDHGMHPPDKQIAPADSKAALDQLVALGYIEEPNADKSKALDETVRELEYNLAQAYTDGGFFTNAIEILERLYARWPMEHRFGFKLATAYQALGWGAELRELVPIIIERRLKEAQEAVATLKELKLDDEEVQKAEKEKLEAMNEREKTKFARERRELMAKARPNLYSLHYLEACADFSERNYEAALAKLEHLENDFGAKQRSLTLRGSILQKLRRWNEAQATFEEALEIDRETPAPLLGLARVHLAQRQFPEVVEKARASVALLYFQPQAHFYIGLARYRMGQWEEAERAFLTCVQQAPLFAAGYRMLSEIARHYRKDPAGAALLHRQVALARRERLKLRDHKILESAKVTATAAGVTPHPSDDEANRPLPELATHPEKLRDHDSSEILTVVSGLPRSGTSLMMQILKAAGIAPFTDDKRTADASNERGYFEHARVAALMTQRDRSWLEDARGGALKVVAPLLPALPPRKFPLRVLFMDRAMDEVLESQEKMLERLGKATHAEDVGKAFGQQLRQARTWCVRHQIPAMVVDYEALVHRTEEVLPEIESFLGVTNDNEAEAMRAVIEPGLHRSRRG